MLNSIWAIGLRCFNGFLVGGNYLRKKVTDGLRVGRHSELHGLLLLGLSVSLLLSGSSRSCSGCVGSGLSLSLKLSLLSLHLCHRSLFSLAGSLVVQSLEDCLVGLGGGLRSNLPHGGLIDARLSRLHGLLWLLGRCRSWGRHRGGRRSGSGLRVLSSLWHLNYDTARHGWCSRCGGWGGDSCWCWCRCLLHSISGGCWLRASIAGYLGGSLVRAASGADSFGLLLFLLLLTHLLNGILDHFNCMLGVAVVLLHLRSHLAEGVLHHVQLAADVLQLGSDCCLSLVIGGWLGRCDGLCGCAEGLGLDLVLLGLDHVHGSLLGVLNLLSGLLLSLRKKLFALIELFVDLVINFLGLMLLVLSFLSLHL